jgi:hypothetical protein
VSSVPCVPSVPATAVFGEPPGVTARLDVAAERGDVVLHISLDNQPFGALVLTLDAALELHLELTGTIIRLGGAAR